MDGTPGAVEEKTDGNLIKDQDPKSMSKPMPDVKPEPDRFDRSLSSILNNRNAAMFVNLECKKRGWELEFEEVDRDGDSHDYTYSYTLTVGPHKDPDSKHAIVTAGIAKTKKDAKRLCCDAMVLKLDELAPAPPLHMGFMRGGPRGRFMRGGWGMRGCFRPGLPPMEGEDAIFKKYDKSPGVEECNKHPISLLSERGMKRGWPMPTWELVTDKVIESKPNRYGRHDVMLFTMKVTIYPARGGSADPRIYFGSGPTKKDAKYACGAVAWADLKDDNLYPQQSAIDSEVATALVDPMERLSAAEVDKLNPDQLKQYLAQQAVAVHSIQTDSFKGFKRPDVDAELWRHLVAKDYKREKKIADREKEREARLAGRKDQEDLIKREIKEEPGEYSSRERSKRRSRSRESSRTSRRSRSRERSSRRSRSRERSTRRSRSRERSNRPRSPGRMIKLEPIERERSSRRSRSRERNNRPRSPSRTIKEEPIERERSMTSFTGRDSHRSSSTFSSSSRAGPSSSHDDRVSRDYY